MRNARPSVIAVLDVLTLGIWEVASTPIEALNQGEKVNVTVHEDENDNVLEGQSSKT